MDKKWIAIIILSITCLALAYIAFKPAKEYGYDEVLHHLQDSLLKENKILHIQDKKLQEENIQKLKQNDSLQNLKSIIQIKYVKVYDENGIITTHKLIHSFDSLFAASGIK